MVTLGDGEGSYNHIQGRDRHALPGPSLLLSLTLVAFADYQTLRIGGLVFAVVLFSVGILLILSKYICSSVHSLRAVSVAVKQVAYGVKGWQFSFLEREGTHLSS